MLSIDWGLSVLILHPGPLLWSSGAFLHPHCISPRPLISIHHVLNSWCLPHTFLLQTSTFPEGMWPLICCLFLISLFSSILHIQWPPNPIRFLSEWHLRALTPAPRASASPVFHWPVEKSPQYCIFFLLFNLQYILFSVLQTIFFKHKSDHFSCLLKTFQRFHIVLRMKQNQNPLEEFLWFSPDPSFPFDSTLLHSIVSHPVHVWSVPSSCWALSDSGLAWPLPESHTALPLPLNCCFLTIPRIPA